MNFSQLYAVYTTKTYQTYLLHVNGAVPEKLSF